jgi:hypothetical protein
MGLDYSRKRLHQKRTRIIGGGVQGDFGGQPGCKQRRQACTNGRQPAGARDKTHSREKVPACCLCGKSSQEACVLSGGVCRAKPWLE